MNKSQDFLKEVRQITKPFHTRLEKLTATYDVFSEGFDLSYYKKFIAAHYFFHREIARIVQSIQAIDPSFVVVDWPQCKRISHLERDSIALGIKEKVLNSDPPQLSAGGAEYCLGLIYVVEGSCMGNAQILELLNKHEEFLELGSQEFLAECQVGFGKRWKAVLRKIESATENGGSKFFEGAKSGFVYFEKTWLHMSDQLF